jgi:hypothetical protein
MVGARELLRLTEQGRELMSDNVSGERSTCRGAHLSAQVEVTGHEDHITDS